MNFLASAIFSLMLLFVSGVLMLVHWRTWKSSRQETLSPMEHDYRRRQYRRRMQASAIIGIVGIALFVGITFFLGEQSLIPWVEDVVVIFTYWLAVVLITIWMALLALVDVWATRRYLNCIHENDLLEQTKLHAELHRLQREKSERQTVEGNGQKEGMMG